MKLAVITDTTAVLTPEMKKQKNLFVLDIPVMIDNVTYVEGKNLNIEDFYDKMAASAELPKTSQPSLAELDSILARLSSENYTHVIGLFLSSGISGFWQNIQFLKEEYPNLMIAFPDSKITCAPLGAMVEGIFQHAAAGDSFELILAKLEQQISGIGAYIMVDDLNHLVKGGRLSNGSALLGNLLNIKPILYFDDSGKIVVYEKVRTEKKALKRLVEIAAEATARGDYQIFIIHSRAQEKAEGIYQAIEETGQAKSIAIVPFDAVIATHLGEGAICVAFTPIV